MSFYLDCDTIPLCQSRHFHSKHLASAESRARDIIAFCNEGEIEIYDDAGRQVATITKNQQGETNAS